MGIRAGRDSYLSNIISRLESPAGFYAMLLGVNYNYNEKAQMGKRTKRFTE